MFTVVRPPCGPSLCSDQVILSLTGRLERSAPFHHSLYSCLHALRDEQPAMALSILRTARSATPLSCLQQLGKCTLLMRGSFPLVFLWYIKRMNCLFAGVHCCSHLTWSWRVAVVCIPCCLSCSVSTNWISSLRLLPGAHSLSPSVYSTLRGSAMIFVPR